MKLSISIASMFDKIPLIMFPSQTKGFSFWCLSGLFIEPFQIISIRSWFFFCVSQSNYRYWLFISRKCYWSPNHWASCSRKPSSIIWWWYNDIHVTNPIHIFIVFKLNHYLSWMVLRILQTSIPKPATPYLHILFLKLSFSLSLQQFFPEY